MKDAEIGMDGKNMSDLILKEIYGICETKNPIEVKDYKMTERECYRRFGSLSKKELNKKNNKEAYVRNHVMTTVIKCCRGEKTRRIIAIDGFRNKFIIRDSDIPKCPELAAKSKIGKTFKNHSFLEEYSLKINEIDPYFYDDEKNTI